MDERLPYWVHIDFGADHRVKIAEETPGLDWHGPFDNWTQAKEYMWNVAMYEIEAIRTIRNGWVGPGAHKQVEAALAEEER